MCVRLGSKDDRWYAGNAAGCETTVPPRSLRLCGDNRACTLTDSLDLGVGFLHECPGIRFHVSKPAQHTSRQRVHTLVLRSSHITVSRCGFRLLGWWGQGEIPCTAAIPIVLCIVLVTVGKCAGLGSTNRTRRAFMRVSVKQATKEFLGFFWATSVAAVKTTLPA